MEPVIKLFKLYVNWEIICIQDNELIHDSVRLPKNAKTIAFRWRVENFTDLKIYLLDSKTGVLLQSSGSLPFSDEYEFYLNRTTPQQTLSIYNGEDNLISINLITGSDIDWTDTLSWHLKNLLIVGTVMLLLFKGTPILVSALSSFKNEFTQDTLYEDNSLSISFSDSSIKLDNFPRPRTGVSGAFRTDFPSDFDSKEIDKKIYDYVRKMSKWGDIPVNIRFADKDKYGQIEKSNWFLIGNINIQETKKYTSFSYWNKQYSITQMFFKAQKEGKLDYSFILIN